MATESPIRITSHKGSDFSPSTPNVSLEDLRLIKGSQTFRGHGRDTIPSRSGSAPPNMEGSYMAVNNLISKQTILDTFQNAESLRSIPHNVDLDKHSSAGNYNFNIVSNPRLTPPIPKENRYPYGFFDKYGCNWQLNTTESSIKNSFQTQVTLATHKEECEDDRSTDQPSDDLNDRTNRLWSSNLIQEDFPRTPSPVYNEAHSFSSTTDEPPEINGESNSLHEFSVSSSGIVTSSADIDGGRQPFSSEPLPVPVASTSSLNCSSAGQSFFLVRKGTSSSDGFASIESGMKNMAISGLLMGKDQPIPDHWPQNHQNTTYHHLVYTHQNSAFHAIKSQVGNQVTGSPYVGMDQLLHGAPKFSTEAQPILQSSGFTPPLYAAATPYMTAPSPYYPNFQTSGPYHQQYNAAGYPSSSALLTPYFAGFPHTAIPVAYDGPTGPNFHSRVPASSSSASVAHGSDLQHLNKLNGQLGYPAQTAFIDPFYMQYYQQSFPPLYSHSGQYDPLVTGGILTSQNLLPDSKKVAEFISGSHDQKPLNQRVGVGYLNHVRAGVIGPHVLGDSQNMSLLMQYPPPPLAMPVFPGSASSSVPLSGGKADARLMLPANRCASVYTGWQGRRVKSYDDPRIHNFLEELKSGKGRRFDLSDITGHVVEFSTDQHGSRFIQQKLESCNSEEKEAVFQEVLPFAPKLMTDVFGNYVVQKFFEYGTSDQRRELANQLSGQILPLSLQMYGCRVIQKALDVIELDQKVQLIHELEGHVMRCVRDQNGNHVIQKCIESVSVENIGFIISAFRGQVAMLSMHPYGCRVIQRVLEHCTDESHFQFIVDEILESVYDLSQNQYGNYVTQHVMERGMPQERFQIVTRLLGHIVPLSQHKFASNVIEKCLEYGDSRERDLIINEVLNQSEGNDNLLVMMKDQFANYVVQKILDTCTDSQRLALLSRIRTHMQALKKYTYGKHIVGRLEQQLEDQA